MYCKGFARDFALRVISKLQLYLIIYDQGEYSSYSRTIIGVYNSFELAIKQVFMCMTHTTNEDKCLKQLPKRMRGSEGCEYTYNGYTIKRVNINEIYTPDPDSNYNYNGYHSHGYRLVPVFKHLTDRDLDYRDDRRWIALQQGFKLSCINCLRRESPEPYLDKNCNEHETTYVCSSEFLTKFNEKWITLYYQVNSDSDGDSES